MKKNPFSEAMERTLKRMGEETDEDLVTYNGLKPHNFRALQRRYGMNEVARYIKIMEAKRQGIPQLGDK